MSEKGYERIRSAVLERILPNNSEKKAAIKQFKEIQNYLEHHHNIESALMGSVAKNTFISGNKDLDIFLFFDPLTKREELEAKSLEIGQKTFAHFKGKFEIKYTEHPYVKGEINKFSIELVPCYKLKFIDKIKSAVDRTPFHTEWVNESLTLKQKEDVVLLKQFLSAHKLYGSTLKIEGFSGYLCELLIYHYSSFYKFIEKVKNWKKGSLIDPKNYWKNLPPDLKKLFKDHPLIVIDPVDKNRNVAAVLVEKNFDKCRKICEEFSKNPSKTFFEKQEIKINLEVLEKKINNKKIYFIEVAKLDIIDDIFYPQLRKSTSKIKRHFEKNEITVLKTGVFEGKTKMRLVFLVGLDSLPKEKVVLGPPIKEKEHVEVFIKKYKKTWENNKRILSKVNRKDRTIDQVYNLFTREIDGSGIPKNLAELFQNTRLRKASTSGKLWQEFLVEFVEDA